MPNVMLTQKGMDFVTCASDLGVLIYLKWFVPVYDDRIDGNIRTSGLTLSAVSAIADVSRTTPYGEIIWNRTGYSVDFSSQYLISSTALVGDSLSNSYQKATTYTNLYNGNPLSDQVSASFWASSAIGETGYYNWDAPNGAVGVTANNPAGSFASDYWRAGDYYPVYEGAGANQLRGSVKCTIDKNRGNFKFNKIALFAQQDGTGETCFFGEAYLNVPAVVSNMAVGFEAFEFDIQIDISGVDATWADIFFSSSADYWSHSPGGLYFPNRIGVGQFDGNVTELSATMHLRYARDDKDTDVPILRMDYDNSRFVGLDISNTPYDLRNSLTPGPTVTHLSGADIIIRIANWGDEGSYNNAISLRPKIPASVALGTSAYPFRELYLNNKKVTGSFGQVGTNTLIPLKVTNEFRNYAIDINDGQVYIGNSNGISTSISDPFGIKLSGIGINVKDSVETVSNNLYGSFKGGDLLRDGQNLLIYNLYCKVGGTSHNVENLYIFAGLDASASYTSVGGQTGPTHKNIVYKIESSDPPLFCSQNTNLANTAELIIGAKGKIGLYGPIELKNINKDSLSTDIIISKAGTEGDYLKRRLLIGTGIINSKTFSDISTIVNNIENNEDDNFQNVLAEGSRLYLVANRIMIDGKAEPYSSPTTYPGIIPVRDVTLTLGTSTKRFVQVNTQFIGVGDLLTGLNLGSFSSYKASSTVTVGIIKQNNTVAQIGQQPDPIDWIFVDQLYPRQIIDASSITTTSLNVYNGLTTNWLDVDYQAYAEQGYRERRRVLAMGEWSQPTGYTWSSPVDPESNGITSLKYAKIGKTVFLKGSFKKINGLNNPVYLTIQDDSEIHPLIPSHPYQTIGVGYIDGNIANSLKVKVFVNARSGIINFQKEDAYYFDNGDIIGFFIFYESDV